MNKCREGFLLFEVIVSMIVIMTGFIFIMRGYTVSKTAIERSNGLFVMSLLMEEKIWEIEEKGRIEQGIKQGVFQKDSDFSWTISAEPVENSDFNLLRLDVSGSKGVKKINYSLFTYVDDEK